MLISQIYKKDGNLSAFTLLSPAKNNLHCSLHFQYSYNGKLNNRIIGVCNYKKGMPSSFILGWDLKLFF